MSMFRQCVECRRIFDLINEIDNDEWHYGHDCEDGYDGMLKDHSEETNQ